MLPHFLVIGAQKSGTTWLYQNLKEHPQVWLPPEKEIHFFDFPPLIPFYALLFSPERSIRHWGKNRLIRDYRKVQAGQQTWSWYLRYYFLPRSERWYASLFTPETQQISGESTPRYAALNEKKIAQVQQLMPQGKFIYLLRNPIERMWSDLAMYHSARFGHQGLDSIEEQQIFKFLQHSQHLANSRYFDNLQRWEKFFSPKQIFIGFHQQMRDEPKRLLQDIQQFLEIDSADQHCIPRLMRKKVNSHSYPEIPPHIAQVLAKLLIDDITNLHQRFNNSYTAEWLTSAETILK